MYTIQFVIHGWKILKDRNLCIEFSYLFEFKFTCTMYTAALFFYGYYHFDEFTLILWIGFSAFLINISEFVNK